MRKLCEEKGVPVRLFCVSHDHEEWLNIHRPSLYQVSYNRDVEDYVYEREKLVRLSGRKYHGKKNHVNKFKRAYPDWSYEPVTDANRQDCLDMLREWKKINSVEEDIEKHAESCVARNYLLNQEMLGQKGGAIRADDRAGIVLNPQEIILRHHGQIVGEFLIPFFYCLFFSAGDGLYVMQAQRPADFDMGRDLPDRLPSGGMGLHHDFIPVSGPGRHEGGGLFNAESRQVFLNPPPPSAGKCYGPRRRFGCPCWLR